MISQKRILILLGIICTISPISIDMYLPAFDAIARDLETSVARVSLSVSSYFVGLAVGQVFYGSLLDRYGRRPPLFIGLFGYLILTVLCAFTHHIEVLIALRFIQAICACSAQVACTAMVRDFFPAKETPRVFSFLFLIVSVSPLLAPSIGTFMVLSWGWHSIFFALALAVAGIMILIYFALPEGHKPDRSVSLHPMIIAKDFKAIILNRQFFIYSLAGSFAFAGLFVYVTGSPSMFLEHFAVSKKTYGLIFAILSVGFIGGSQFNNLLMNKFKISKIFRFCVHYQLLVGGLFLGVTLLGFANLTVTMFFLFFFLVGSGIAFPNAAALAINPFSENAGRASALLGLLQMSIGALMSSLLGLFSVSGILPTVIIMAATPLIAFIFLQLEKDVAVQ